MNWKESFLPRRLEKVLEKKVAEKKIEIFNGTNHSIVFIPTCSQLLLPYPSCSPLTPSFALRSALPSLPALDPTPCSLLALRHALPGLLSASLSLLLPTLIKDVA